MRVLILGASGFLGRRVAQHLSAQGIEVRAPTRDRERAKAQLILLPTLDMPVADVHDPAQLGLLVAGTDAVINLVGVLHDGRGGFQRAHIDLPRKLVDACRHAGVSRVLHVSALHASASGPSRYLRSKGEGERLIGEATDLHPTVFRPSVIFGEGDRFLTLFARMAALTPVIPLACAEARFQPIYAEDVARAITLSLALPATQGQRYDLCGPRVYTLRELVRYAARQGGHVPAIVGLPASVGRLQAAVMEHLPGRLLTRDNLDSMRLDSVSAAPFPEVFGFQPTPLEAVAPRYLGNATSRARYDVFRAQR